MFKKSKFKLEEKLKNRNINRTRSSLFQSLKDRKQEICYLALHFLTKWKMEIETFEKVTIVPDFPIVTKLDMGGQFSIKNQ